MLTAKEKHGVKTCRGTETRPVYFVLFQNGHEGAVSIAVYGLNAFDAMENAMSIAKESPLTLRLLNDLTYVKIEKEPRGEYERA